MQGPTPPPSNPTRAGETTRLLRRVADGEQGLEGQLLELLYGELRQVAGALMRGERDDHTLQPTALLHEAWLRLDLGGLDAGSCRGQFLRLASRAMRGVLVDHARRRNALKRGSGRRLVAVDEEAQLSGEAGAIRVDQVLEIEEVLGRLAGRDPELAQIVEMRFFGGVSAAEIGAALGKTRRQIEASWAFARGWLRRELERGDAVG
ncbi:MAG: ECF-type sigma factor [Planctomycetota bacterium]